MTMILSLLVALTFLAGCASRDPSPPLTPAQICGNAPLASRADLEHCP